MIVELGSEPPAPLGISRAALPIILASVVAALALPADRNAYQPLDQLPDVTPVRALVLPAGVTGVRLAAMPDRLLNDQPLSSLIWAVQVRGREAVASHENGTTTVLWTERGTVYWLTSTQHGINELVAIGNRLSLRRPFLIYGRDGEIAD